MNQKLLFGGLITALVVLLAGALLFMNKADVNETQAPIENLADDELQADEDSDSTEESEDADQQETRVTLSASGFSPKTITINAGDKVIWMNSSGKTATIDSNPHPVHTSYPEMNLGSFSDGESLEFIFPEPGTYNYHNHLNASQGGTVVVE